MTPSTNSKIESLAAVSLTTFVGAFVGAFVQAGGLPTTLESWKTGAIIGVFAGLIAELRVLHAQLPALVAGSPLAPIVADLGSVEPLAEQLIAALEKLVAARVGIQLPAPSPVQAIVAEVAPVAAAVTTTTAVVQAVETKLT